MIRGNAMTDPDIYGLMTIIDYLKAIATNKKMSTARRISIIEVIANRCEKYSHRLRQERREEFAHLLSEKGEQK